VLCRDNQGIIARSERNMGWAGWKRDCRKWLEGLRFHFIFTGRSLDGFSDRLGGGNNQAIRARANNESFRLRDS
jgi:hypothetical protein